MTLIHDLAECIVGDITPHDNITPEDKHEMEDKAMEQICKLLGDKGPEMLEIFRVRILNSQQKYTQFTKLIFQNLY